MSVFKHCPDAVSQIRLGGDRNTPVNTSQVKKNCNNTLYTLRNPVRHIRAWMIPDKLAELASFLMITNDAVCETKAAVGFYD